MTQPNLINLHPNKDRIIQGNSMIICDKIKESYEEGVDAEAWSNDEAKSHDETNTIPTSFNEKKAVCKQQNVYILLAFLLFTIVLLIAADIYSYLIKYQARQKHLLPFHFTNNKLKEIVY